MLGVPYAQQLVFAEFRMHAGSMTAAQPTGPSGDQTRSFDLPGTDL